MHSTLRGSEVGGNTVKDPTLFHAIGGFKYTYGASLDSYTIARLHSFNPVSITFAIVTCVLVFYYPNTVKYYIYTGWSSN